MSTATMGAKERLQEALKQQRKGSNSAIRIIPYPSIVNQLDMGLDKEREGNQVVKSELGSNLLLIAHDIALTLDGMLIDVKATSQSSGFFISRLNPDN
jgi:Fe-S cluster assembly iron-binding protein IscA